MQMMPGSEREGKKREKDEERERGEGEEEKGENVGRRGRYGMDEGRE